MTPIVVHFVFISFVLPTKISRFLIELRREFLCLLNVLEATPRGEKNHVGEIRGLLTLYIVVWSLSSCGWSRWFSKPFFSADLSHTTGTHPSKVVVAIEILST